MRSRRGREAALEEEPMWKRRSFCAAVLTATLIGLGQGARVGSAETVRESYSVKGFT